jgi:transcriptional regulator with XRE-family HTH domain
MVRISDLRKARNWTQEELADRIGEHGVAITAAGISNVENGNKQASDRLLAAWALALGVEPLNVWHGPLRTPVQPGVPTKRSAA